MSTKRLTKEEYLERYKRIAEGHGGACLSEYTNAKTKMKFRCEDGHEWWTTPNKIQQGNWCSRCGDERTTKKRIAKAEMNFKKIIINRHGTYAPYIDAHTKIEIFCEHGHRFESQPTRIISGGWCPICVNAKKGSYSKLNIKMMHELAKSKGGDCLSNTYINANTKIRWSCKEGHIFNARPGNVTAGHWCFKCANAKPGHRLGNIDDMHRIAKERGGKCLSKEYIDSKTNIHWQCKERHQWWANPGNIKIGKWCPVCAGVKKHTIAYMHELAKEHGGKCLSAHYTNLYTKIKWVCNKGHEWQAIPKNIIIGCWCPECNFTVSKGEKECKVIFERLFNRHFIKVNPDWLHSLQLDGYCKELNLAFEYNGKQHYEEVPIFQRGDDFKKQLERDILKNKLCIDNRVTLITISHTIKLNEIKDFIVSECNNKGIEIGVIA